MAEYQVDTKLVRAQELKNIYAESVNFFNEYMPRYVPLISAHVRETIEHHCTYMMPSTIKVVMTRDVLAALRNGRWVESPQHQRFLEYLKMLDCAMVLLAEQIIIDASNHGFPLKISMVSDDIALVSSQRQKPVLPDSLTFMLDL